MVSVYGGVMGEKTVNALREFQQRKCRMIADGKAGPLTWTVLVNASLGDLAPVTTPEKKEVSV
jgi:hypothetical protein